MRQIASLTVTRARWSTLGHGTRLQQQERRAAVGLDRLSAEGLARFPFPPHGRIPNFAGAEVAADDSLTSSRGRAPQPSRSIRIHRNAR